QHLYRRQIAAIITSLIIPWVGNILYLSGSSPFENLDLAPFSFTLSGVVVAWGLFHSKLLEVIPIAHNTVIENMSEAVIVMDLHSRLISASPAAQSLFGKKITRAYGQTVSELFPKFWQKLEQLESGSRTEIELEKDDAPHNFELYYSLLYNQQNHLSGYLIVLHDITEQKQTEVTIAQLKTEAEQANRAKNTFLANMGHEMRTPMNVILGYTQLLGESKDLQPHHHKSVHAIGQTGRNLLELITNILNLSKIDAGHEQVNLTDFDLENLVKELDMMFKTRCQQKQLDWQLDADAAERYVVGDESKLRQVLLNLLDNAVKFTSKGEIKFRIETHPDHQVYFEVSDTGPGIPEE
ncbi:MAG: histidine kinase N-terminal 7TM domain-containing protein, partial [SAR324 cluster bacterium]|nr:histidine kinase N-terminal 7TM domain-containing protein [SAR324 cluster bacterium]